MKIGGRKDTPLLGLAVLIACVFVTGCERSSRQITLGRKVIETQTPIQLDRRSIPIAASPDGSRIALEVDREGDQGSTITVVETDTQKALGSINVKHSTDGTPIFTRDGKELCLATDNGYSAWSYETGQLRAIDFRPRPKAFSYWNQDRTIALDLPTRDNSGKMAPGQLALANGVAYEIPATSRAGFDQFGNAWFGNGGSWTRVERDGKTSRSLKNHPTLVKDQTRDRGSLHLTTTQTRMTYRKAKCFLTCIWMSHDKPYSPNSIVEPDRAAVVFAGPDVLAFGFFPGRNMVYVVSDFGCYLVPFETKKHS